MRVEWESDVIRQAAATFCIQVPMSEKSAAIQSARKSGRRSGAHASAKVDRSGERGASRGDSVLWPEGSLIDRYEQLHLKSSLSRRERKKPRGSFRTYPIWKR